MRPWLAGIYYKMWHHVERMTHCRIKKHPPQIKRGGCFFVFGKNFNLMTLGLCLLLFIAAVFPVGGKLFCGGSALCVCHGMALRLFFLFFYILAQDSCFFQSVSWARVITNLDRNVFQFFVWLGENFFRRLLPCFCYSTFSSFNAKYFLEVLQKRPKNKEKQSVSAFQCSMR